MLCWICVPISGSRPRFAVAPVALAAERLLFSGCCTNHLQLQQTVIFVFRDHIYLWSAPCLQEGTRIAHPKPPRPNARCGPLSFIELQSLLVLASLVIIIQKQYDYILDRFICFIKPILLSRGLLGGLNRLRALSRCRAVFHFWDMHSGCAS
jgi:hypothetical protein